MGLASNKTLIETNQLPIPTVNSIKNSPYRVITGVFFSTLFLAGWVGALALIGGHWAPLSAFNTAISGAWTGLPYAMTGIGIFGLGGIIGLAIFGIYKHKQTHIENKPHVEIVENPKQKEDAPPTDRIKKFDFGSGCTQYQHPKPRTDALDCSFIAAYSILHIYRHFDELDAAIKENDLESIKKIHLEILEKGYAISHPTNDEYSAKVAVNPEDLHKFTNAFDQLNIPKQEKKIEGYVIYENGVAPKALYELKKETHDHLIKFFETECDSTEVSYLLVVVDGQTFSLTRHKQYTFLFDSHRSCFQSVDCNATEKHIFTTILGDNALQNGEISLYQGKMVTEV